MPDQATSEDPPEERRHSPGRRQTDEFIDRLATETQFLNERVTRLTDALLTVSDVQRRQMDLEESLRAGREENRDLADMIAIGIQDRNRMLYRRMALACAATFVVTLLATYGAVFFTWHH